MIPYFEFPPWKIGPFPISPFGLLAVSGIFLGAKINASQARRDGLDARILDDYAPWGVGAGVVVGHWVHLFLYHPEELAQGGPLQIFKVWEGLSSFGGLLGGVLAALVYFRLRRVPFAPYQDALALGVAPGWAVARIGCFLIHDHPGARSDFFLAVQFPGGARHDLGLEDFLLLMAISGALHLLRSRGALQGRLLHLLALLYGLGRFGLDFLRAADLAYVDRRYSGLTPAQYGCVLLVLFGVAGLTGIAGGRNRVFP